MNSIIAVRVRLDSGVDRYFLTWGDLGSNRRWPGDIERAVLQLLGDEDIDRVMCLGRDVSGAALAAIVAGRAITVDEAGYTYVLSPWADAGYRTPRGYFPPPR